MVIATTLSACGPGSPGGPTINHKVAQPELATGTSKVVSSDVLAREPIANTAQVKHILISWKDLDAALGGRLDERAKKRSKADAEAEVTEIVGLLKAGGNFDQLMKERSEDTGSAASARAFTVTPDAQLVIEFRQLSLRLRLDEVGVVESEYGFHVIKRYE